MTEKLVLLSSYKTGDLLARNTRQS